MEVNLPSSMNKVSISIDQASKRRQGAQSKWDIDGQATTCEQSHVETENKYGLARSSERVCLFGSKLLILITGKC